jgi:hypothetical protein
MKNVLLKFDLFDLDPLPIDSILDDIIPHLQIVTLEPSSEI